jgi:hypothetical protein
LEGLLKFVAVEASVIQIILFVVWVSCTSVTLSVAINQTHPSAADYHS